MKSRTKSQTKRLPGQSPSGETIDLQNHGEKNLLALPETPLALRAEEHSVYVQVDWHQVPSEGRLSVKKATG
jgi:hypothetical protein